MRRLLLALLLCGCSFVTSAANPVIDKILILKDERRLQLISDGLQSQHAHRLSESEGQNGGLQE